MADILSEVIVNVVASPWLPLVMFVIAVVDGFFPPIPSESVLVAAAAAAASAARFAPLLLVCAAAAAGAAIGDNIAYALGRRIGTERFGWMRRPRVVAAVARARGMLARRGVPLILGARYVPIGRVAVNMTAGAVGYPWRRFVPISIVAGVSWAIFSVAIGLFAGAWLQGNAVLSALFGIAIALAIGFTVERIATFRHRRSQRGEEDFPA